MNTENISYTRNHLSELLDLVKAGESVLILDRQTPVARLEPVTAPRAQVAEWKAALVRQGVIRVATRPLDPTRFIGLPPATPAGKGDILASLLAEREGGR
jgi:antitoxin (DNA-binding transcriptional repressor) of toxin-antitoxin stability system